MRKILPITLDTGLTTDCCYHMKLVGVLSDERYTPWYVERFIELEMGIREGVPIEDFWIFYYRKEYFDVELLFQGVLDFNRFDITDSLDIVAESVDNINRGGYVLLGCDNYYISKSDFYHKHHCLHEYLLFGFDTLEKVFHILLLKDNKWTTETVSFEEMEQAFQAGLNTIRNEFKGHYWLLRFDMPATSFFPNPNFKRKPYLTRILESIENYLIGGVNQNVREAGNLVTWTGLSIYDGLLNQICGIIEEHPSFLMERNIILGMKRICENKRGMLMRLQYLHDHQYIQVEDQLFGMFQGLCESLDKLYALFIVYHHRPSKENMELIKNRIQRTAQLDKAAMEGAHQVIYDGVYKSLNPGIKKVSTG